MLRVHNSTSEARMRLRVLETAMLNFSALLAGGYGIDTV
jgi:hypothetical protein